MDFDNAVRVIENCSGFTERDSAAGEAWQCVLDHIESLNQRINVRRMTNQMYAAIHLRIPESGDAAIDAMIIKARHLDATERFLAQLVNSITFPQEVEDQLHKAGVATKDFEAFGVHVAEGFADAMKARKA